jgi:CRISPR-associated protein Cmr6
MEYPIPKKSADAWRIFQKTSAPHNPGLIFDRFVQNWGQSTDNKAKQKAWEEIEAATKKVDSTLLQSWNIRWEKTVRNAKADPFLLKTDWRFIAGLGRKGSLEVGFTFHRYGFPMLPGSSVKGIARAWGLVSLAAALDADRLNKLNELLSIDDEKKFLEAFGQTYSQTPQQHAIQAREFRMLFGTTGVAGCAVFFDAIPARLPKLKLDIMNPHYPKYYQGTEPPTDWQSPIPVYFLTVAPGTEFRFAVGWRGPLSNETRRLCTLAQEWLIKGLTELGAGAKTSAGYGYFTIAAAPIPSANKQSRR